MKILIMGLPGNGKTALAKMLSRELGAAWFNADRIRNNIYPDLGFDLAAGLSLHEELDFCVTGLMFLVRM